MDVGDKLRQFQSYVKDLEEELYKIMVFKREFPLSIQLVSHQIHSCRMIIGDDNQHPAPELEFISLKPTFSSSSEKQTSSEKESPQKRMLTSKNGSSDWMSLPIKPIATITKKLGGAFHPFEKENLTLSTAAEPAAEASLKDEEEGKSQSSKKRRRYWSSDLHHRFMDALQQLGGSDVATPKQIRELMQIDNLTNDEVKSHLQKYRLHTKRPPPAIQSSSSQAPQFLVVGKIWFPSAVQQSNEESGAPLSGIYAPNASKPSLNGPLNYDGRRCGQDSSSSLANDGATNSSSHTSSQTITT